MVASSFPVDFLSFCPSLLDILQHLDYKDVPNCRLVNKRLSGIIRSHSLTMQRKNAVLTIENVLMEWIPAKFAVVHLTTSHNLRNLIYVTEKRTILMKYAGEVGNYYWKNGIPSEYAPDQEDEKIRSAIRNNHSGEDLERSRSYQNNGIEDGLRKLFTILCPRYKFRISLAQSFDKNFNPQQKKRGIVPEKWLNVLVEELHRNRCCCDVLDIRQPMPGLEEFAKTIDCRDICLFVSSTEAEFMTSLGELSNWDRHIRLFKTFGKFDNFEETGILEKWKAGSWSLNKVEFRGTCYSLQCTWSQTVDELMTGINADFEKNIVPDKPIEYVVKRKADTKKLLIKCKGFYLQIKEVL